MKWQISGSKVTQTKWIQNASRPCKLAVGKTQQPHYISVYYVLPMFTRHIIITTTLIISLADRQLSQIKQTQQRSKNHKMNDVTYRSPLKGRKLPNILCMFGKKPEHAKFVSYSTAFFLLIIIWVRNYFYVQKQIFLVWLFYLISWKHLGWPCSMALFSFIVCRMFMNY